MCMRKDEVIYLFGIETKVSVHGVGFKALALIHTTVEQYLQPFLCSDEVLTSRHLFCSA